MPAVLPTGELQKYRGTTAIRRDSFVSFIRSVAERRSEKIMEAANRELMAMVEELRATTPKDTGAAAGTTVGAKRSLYPSHPASRQGLSIGNEPGDSGWQIYKSGDLKKIAIINPMWETYLKTVNYTSLTHANFLETARRHFLQRIKTMRIGD